MGLSVRAYLAQPEWLWLLAALPLLAWRVAAGRARRARDWSALGNPWGTGPSAGGGAGWLAAAFCLVIALAQPRWGRTERPPLPPGHDVVLALDVSRSMAAEDAVPHRLGRAVESAGSLIPALGAKRGDRVAVVAFAGRGVTRCPLTENLGAVADTLGELRPGSIRPGGTDLGAAIDAALEAFDDQDHAQGRTVVLFSDGEDHAGSWRAAVERARERGVTVHAVAVGDVENGHPVPLRGPASGKVPGRAEPLRYQGEVVLSRRSDEALNAIARSTGGAFVPLGLASTDLGRLYRSRIEPEARARRAVTLAPEPAERFGVFVLAAVGFGLTASRPTRRRSAASRVWVTTLAAAAAVVALIVVTLGAGPETDRAKGTGKAQHIEPADRDAPSLVARGREAYAANRFGEALEAFQRAVAVAPRDPVPRYDAAAALFQLGRHAEARDSYLDARRLAGAALRTKIDYALGNSAVALGDLAGAVRHYDDCLASTARGADLEEVRRRASANKRYVEEQAKHSPPPTTSNDGKNPDKSPDRDRDRSGDDGPSDQQGDGSGSSGGRQGESARSKSPPGRGRSGGSGGGGPNNSPTASGSPEGRLEKALEDVREARRSRLDDDAPQQLEDSRDLKDW
jgi:Ca-activated chloride channel family protein